MQIYRVFLKGGMELFKAGKSAVEVRQELENDKFLVLSVVNEKCLEGNKHYV